MRYEATILHIGEHVEEEVDILIENQKLTVFASVCPYPIEIGKEYSVDIQLTVFDEIKITLLKTAAKSIRRIHNDFRYAICGCVTDGGKMIDAGLIFDGEDLLEFENLSGKYIEIEVNRIDAVFQ